jgi:hypothetical protein
MDYCALAESYLQKLPSDKNETQENKDNPVIVGFLKERKG